MNLTIGTTFPSTWKRIRTRYVALACGVALAAGVVIGLSAWQGGSAGSSGSGAEPVSVASSQPAVTFYIVDSAEEAQAFYVAQQASDQPPAVPIVAGSFDESALRGAAAQLLGVGEKGAAAFRIVDLRGR